MDSFCFPKNTKNPNPSPIGKKFGFCCCGAPPGTRTLAPLIKRNRCATIVNFQNCVSSLFLAFCRSFTFCTLCIIRTCCSVLHLLSSYSGVQKVCKNVQSQNQPLKTGIGFLQQIPCLFIGHEDNAPIAFRMLLGQAAAHIRAISCTHDSAVVFLDYLSHSLWASFITFSALPMA